MSFYHWGVHSAEIRVKNTWDQGTHERKLPKCKWVAETTAQQLLDLCCNDSEDRERREYYDWATQTVTAGEAKIDQITLDCEPTSRWQVKWDSRYMLWSCNKWKYINRLINKMFNLALSRRCFRGGWMGLRVSSGPGVTIRLDLGTWLVNTGLVSSSGEKTHLISDLVKVERRAQVNKCRVMMKGLRCSRWDETDVCAQFQAWKTSSCCLRGRRTSCGSTWRTGRAGRRRPSTPPSQSTARMSGISFTWAASLAEQQVRKF